MIRLGLKRDEELSGWVYKEMKNDQVGFKKR